MLSYYNKFRNISYLEKALFFRGIFFLFLFKIIVKVVPLKYYKHLLIANKNESSGSLKEYHIKLVKKTMKRIQRILWFKPSCLINSMTIKILLNSLGISSKVELSVNITDDIISAHAYVTANENYTFLRKKGFKKVFIP